MCGIFAYLGPKKNAGDIVLDGLKSLEYRGYDSWGIALKLHEGNIHLEKHTGKIGEAKLPKFTSGQGIGHTRWATHGGVIDKNTHPHADCHNRVLIVHNGIVENFQSLKNNLLKLGHRFTSETDSEVIAHLIEKELNKTNNFNKAVLNVFHFLKGMNAIIVFFPEKEQFVAIKNGSPLVFGYSKTNKEYIIASDPFAILPHAKNLYFLEDNELLEIGSSSHVLYDLKGRKKKINFVKMDFDGKNLSLGRYPHFMIKEISEQPKVLENIVVNEEANIRNVAEKIKKAYGAYLIGCGTAYYACLAGSYLFSKIAKRHINASIGSEFAYLVDFLKKTSLVIALSQSGETIDTISSIKLAKQKGGQILAVTNVLGSTLYRTADFKMLLGAGPEKCVLATKSFTAKIAILYLLAHALNRSYKKGKDGIKKAIKEAGKLIKSDKIRVLAEKIKNRKHIYILGRGVSYPTALESALKIKEVSYIHAEGFAAGELKHGVIALIEKGTPVIVYNPEDETYEDTLSSAHEVKARGAYVIGISSKNNPVFDEFIKVENCQEATVIPNVVVAQLLGYHLAVSLGYDPDKPRNLAKSVTVK
jgi:glucosamine--fructose-6-phosphate aminotransferase (isomerizing)